MMKMPKCVNLNLVVIFFSHFKFLIITVLNHFGLASRPREPLHTEPTHHYVLVTDGLCPNIYPVQADVLAALIKKKIRVVEYGKFLEGLEEGEEDENGCCRVCFECVESKHEIRELPNCRHVFHRECLDCWVEQNQITCPLCRSLLYPAKAGVTTHSWILDKDSNAYRPPYY